MTETRTRCGFVAVIGAPNAGKSTLVNALVGTKVSIVSRKVQTTRMRVRGVAMHGDAQVVLVDTPGIFKPRRRLDRAMVQAAWAGAEEADLVCLLVDAPELIESPNGLSAQDTDSIIKRLNEAGQHAILVLNKVDALARDRLLPLIEQLRARLVRRGVPCLGGQGGRHGGPAFLSCVARARGAVGLSCRPGSRHAHAPACGGDHARADL